MLSRFLRCIFFSHPVDCAYVNRTCYRGSRKMEKPLHQLLPRKKSHLMPICMRLLIPCLLQEFYPDMRLCEQMEIEVEEEIFRHEEVMSDFYEDYPESSISNRALLHPEWRGLHAPAAIRRNRSSSRRTMMGQRSKCRWDTLFMRTFLEPSAIEHWACGA